MYNSHKEPKLSGCWCSLGFSPKVAAAAPTAYLIEQTRSTSDKTLTSPVTSADTESRNRERKGEREERHLLIIVGERSTGGLGSRSASERDWNLILFAAPCRRGAVVVVVVKNDCHLFTL